MQGLLNAFLRYHWIVRQRPRLYQTPVSFKVPKGGRTSNLRSRVVQIWNPSFDVTPAELITGIITEEGLVPKSHSNEFDVPGMAGEQRHQQGNGKASSQATHGSNIPGFFALDTESVTDYLASKPELCKRLGDPSSKAQWKVALTSKDPVRSIETHLALFRASNPLYSAVSELICNQNPCSLEPLSAPSDINRDPHSQAILASIWLVTLSCIATGGK